ncbi:MAG: cell division protein ZapB [Desulfomonilaceae bacterium]
MGITNVLAGLKNKVLDAATYELLRRNFELLEENNQQLKERVGSLKEEVEHLKAESLRLTEQTAGLEAQLDQLKRQDEFVEESGLAFLKNSDGTVRDVACCPECHTRLGTVDERIYVCQKCNYKTRAHSGAYAVASVINQRLKSQV